VTLPTLWHFTCDHAARRIGDRGDLVSALVLVPDKPLPWWSAYVWLTDLAHPPREALGLTSRMLSCDRLAHRYRVLDASGAYPWVAVRRNVPERLRAPLELQAGVRLVHWWVALGPVPVVEQSEVTAHVR
jgi:hypothetical protein